MRSKGQYTPETDFCLQRQPPNHIPQKTKKCCGTMTLSAHLHWTRMQFWRSFPPWACPGLRKWSGVNNTLLFPGNPGCKLDGFRMVSWNAHALFCESDIPKLRRKVLFLWTLSRESSLVCVQDTHGSRASLEQYFKQFSRHFWCYPSFLSHRAGGVLILVNKSVVLDQSRISFEAVVQGRVARVAIVGAEGTHSADSVEFPQFWHIQG